MEEISVHQGFTTMESAIEAVEEAMQKQFQPIRRETKEMVRNFNKKCRKEERRITELAEDQQYSQR